MATGGVAAVIFAVSGIVPNVSKWADHSRVTRQVFGDVPSPIEVVFYGVMVTMALTLGWLWSNRVRNWTRGRPDNRSRKDMSVDSSAASYVTKFPGTSGPDWRQIRSVTCMSVPPAAHSEWRAGIHHRPR